ncbi:HEAT repeat domain-containing protein [Winogradskya humida]|uniref:BON domain-containing protein n=1 Tax=Winogradskya humida TaxID=113566 RepID=A0ABQ3ZQE1_9ACTN|nr:HEAT repeat domain-containing protein [Actinoplanes humidus]GIE20392.1 hypothetical protein Ahu01nite_034940 [Actinoplanes humidus]
MAGLMHLTPQRNAARVLRSGVAARSRGRGVYCMAVLPSFTLTHQWVRELRRWHPGVLAAVHIRIPDNEMVLVGRYNAEPQRVTAAQAVAIIRDLADPRGYEIFVPRAIKAGEVRHVRQVPQGLGWRYQPNAHGTRPCSCCIQRGTPAAGRDRRRYPYDSPRPTKPQLMAKLQVAETAEEIIDVLWDLGARSRGDAEELAYLVDHPDEEVREVLYEVLSSYRGQLARDLRVKLSESIPTHQ